MPREEKDIRNALTRTQLILLILARGCQSLEELEAKTGLTHDQLLVYLSRLHKRGLIYRRWRHFMGRKIREYCLKESYKL